MSKKANLETLTWYTGLALIGGAVISPIVYWYVNKFKK